MSDDSNSAENSQAAVRKKILIVDDDREIVESMRIALDACGYQIVVARDGNQGLELAGLGAKLLAAGGHFLAAPLVPDGGRPTVLNSNVEDHLQSRPDENCPIVFASL